MKRGRIFRFSRAFVRLYLGRWTVDIPAPQGPTVYVCHHGNLRGPITTMCFVPYPVRPWALHFFSQRETCRVHFRDYTFSKRYKMPQPLASALAWAVSGYVSGLMRSMGAIPVYRGSIKISATFRASVEALKAGDPLLIFPDVDYAQSGGEVGDLYDGFLLLDRFWHRASKEPLRFVPLTLDGGKRRVIAGEPQQFDPAKDWEEERARIRDALHRELRWSRSV